MPALVLVLALSLLTAGIASLVSAFFLIRSFPVYNGYTHPTDIAHIPSSEAIVVIPPKSLSYTPHSGLHNQRIALQNALFLASVLDRTLILPPAHLGPPIPFAEPSTLARLLLQFGSLDCPLVGHDLGLVTPECADALQSADVSWSSIFSLPDRDVVRTYTPPASAPFPYLSPNLSTLGTTYSIPSQTVYAHRYASALPPPPSPVSKVSYASTIPISFLQSLDRVDHLALGSLHGSTRIYLPPHSPHAVLLASIRTSIRPSHPAVLDLAQRADRVLGGAFLGAHVRLSDGAFAFPEQQERTVVEVWTALISQLIPEHDLALVPGAPKLAAASRARLHAVAPEHRSVDEANHNRVHKDPSDHPNKAHYHHSQQPDGPPLPPPSSRPLIPCRGRAHTSTSLSPLNVPLFIATDVPSPRSNTALKPLLDAFPCAFFLGELGLVGANASDNGSGESLSPLLLPLLDASIVARARFVAVTPRSTFSGYVRDVLWRAHWGLL